MHPHRPTVAPPTVTTPQVFSHYPAIPPPLPLKLIEIDERTCPYKPERDSTSRAVYAQACDDVSFERLLDAGFRRSGRVIYQQSCRGCRACVPIRVDSFAFCRSASQRRIWRRNEDLAIDIGLPDLTEEKVDLYQRYLRGQHHATHDPSQDDRPEDIRQFLYDSPVSTVEITYREPGGRLVGVGICDVTPNVVSSVYFYWDPEARRRSLGWFSMLWELDVARQSGRRWYHLGYWVEGAPTMDYKQRLKPHEVLCTDGVWRARD